MSDGGLSKVGNIGPAIRGGVSSEGLEILPERVDPERIDSPVDICVGGVGVSAVQLPSTIKIPVMPRMHLYEDIRKNIRIRILWQKV